MTYYFKLTCRLIHRCTWPSRYPAQRARGRGHGVECYARVPLVPGLGGGSLHREVVSRRTGVLPLRAQRTAQHARLLTDWHQRRCKQYFTLKSYQDVKFTIKLLEYFFIEVWVPWTIGPRAPHHGRSPPPINAVTLEVRYLPQESWERKEGRWRILRLFRTIV